jgi:hypothetical protein
MPKIFISYRQADSLDVTSRIFDRMQRQFGKGNVFMDIDTTRGGTEVGKHIMDTISQCNFALVIIGKDWLDARYRDGPKQGQRRLDDPTDSVCIEIQTALEGNITVIPVLVGGASIPSDDALPDGLKTLCRRAAAEIGPGRDFRPHLDRLIAGIEGHPVPSVASPAPPPTPAPVSKKEEPVGRPIGIVDVNLTVPGTWYCGENGEAHTPATVKCGPHDKYGLEVKTDATDGQLAGLAVLKKVNLVRLSLVGCEQITDTGLANMEGLSTVTHLSLSDCARITDDGLAQLKKLPLGQLDLARCKLITDSGLTHLAKMASLRSLNLGGCSNVTDNGVAHLSILAELRQLTLRGTKVSDAGLAHLYQKLFSLELVDLGGCDKVTDDGLRHLKSITALQDLNLQGCDITDDGLNHLRNHSDLQQLNLADTGVTNEGVKNLKKRLSGCTIKT